MKKKYLVPAAAAAAALVPAGRRPPVVRAEPVISGRCFHCPALWRCPAGPSGRRRRDRAMPGT